MGLYIAIPNASHDVVEIATGTALKTVLQVAIPSTTDILVLAWGVDFDGTSGDPGRVVLLDTNVAATVTSLTPQKWGSDDAPASLCIGGTSATGTDASAEGTITATRILDAHNITPNSGGYSIWFPRPPKVKASRFLRVRTLFGATVNCLPWVLWAEPAEA